MPKRKRYTRQEDHADSNHICRQKVVYKLAQSKKQLYRVLKIARSFERQKLGRRLIRAETVEAKAKFDLEIQVLKELDLSKVVDTQLYKSLLKVKSFVESGLLPPEVKRKEKESSENAAEDAAFNNVISGMFNIKTVKDTMVQILRDLYFAMGIPVPKVEAVNEKKPESNTFMRGHPDKISENSDDKIYEVEAKEVINAHKSPEWEGFDSSEETLEKNVYGNLIGNESIDEEFKLYETRLGASSDDDSFEENKFSYKQNSRSSFHAIEATLSDVSDTTSNHSLNSSSNQPFSKHTDSLRIQRSAQNKPTSAARAGLSTFLPTLMGDYWSGSEESASDLENFTPGGKKKNRRGQMARRAIAEKKYGHMANHIKSGKAEMDKRGRKDEGWDAKRGAINTKQPLNRSRAHGYAYYSTAKFGRPKSEEVTEINSDIVSKSRVKSILRHRDDLGNLHPSWEAAKKAKELKQMAEFQGKKVKFE